MKQPVGQSACWTCVLIGSVIPSCAAPNSPSAGDTSATACDGTALPSGPTQRITVLDESMTELRRDFNAHSHEWRVVLLVSPTCSECILGAEAVEREIMARYPAKAVHGQVVWGRMLEGDNEATALQSSGIIPRSNAAHFYDDHQASGWAWHRGPFAGMARRVKAALPPDHWLIEAWAQHREDSPQWDLYMLYAPGVRWADSGEADAPPAPTAWVRHIGRTEDGESVYWRDTPDTQPLMGDLFVAMRAMADDTIGTKARPGGTGAAATAVPKIELLGFPDCPNTPEMRDQLKAALGTIGGGWTFMDVNQRALPPGDLRRGYPTPTILVDGRDLYGLPVPKTATMSCRVYPDGVPSSQDIARRLEAFKAR